MTGSPDTRDVERFRKIVARRLGLHFDDAKLGFLEEVLRRRAEADGHVCGTYLGRLEFLQPAYDEVRALASELTVAETYFFRNPDQFRALAQSALPSRMKVQAAGRKLRILSAGCASGEEAYSLAIVLRENMPDPSWALSIRAVDINPAMLEKARRARYSTWSLRETPQEIQHRWFPQDGREFLLDATVRRAVDFEERNLAEDDPELWRPESYDVVFCRNVLMYFTPEQAQALVRRITAALLPGGYLFLGHAETLRGLSQNFHLQHTHGTFYYRRRTASERDEQREGPISEAVDASAFPFPLLPPLVEDSDSWVEVIGRAANRIQALTDAPRDWAVTGLASAKKPVWDLGLSLELLKRERYAEALELMHALPPESARDPEVLLLRAVLLTHGGQFEQAEAVCGELLQIDELNSGAQYLLALCRDGMGDRNGAVEHNQVAVYLDPSFAMPRLHLGLLGRRAGDAVAARLEFGHAMVLLQREDPSRLLLFGGGFGRESLIALCRAELRACGDTP
jgi:chemotaxis protein methyltransferase CheR